MTSYGKTTQSIFYFLNILAKLLISCIANCSKFIKIKYIVSSHHLFLPSNELFSNFLGFYKLIFFWIILFVCMILEENNLLMVIFHKSFIIFFHDHLKLMMEQTLIFFLNLQMNHKQKKVQIFCVVQFQLKLN